MVPKAVCLRYLKVSKAGCPVSWALIAEIVLNYTESVYFLSFYDTPGDFCNALETAETRALGVIQTGGVEFQTPVCIEEITFV